MIRYSLLALVLIIVACTSDDTEKAFTGTKELNIYYTGSFLIDNYWEQQFGDFGRQQKCSILTRVFPDSWEMLNYYATQRDSDETVDILLGVDNFIMPEFDELELIESFSYVHSEMPVFINGRNKKIFPVAYSYLGFIYNSELVKDPPLTFGAMQDGIWKDKIVMFDPRKNSLGRGMLLWSLAAFGENGFGHFWRSIRDNVYRNSSDFNEAYSLFLAKEAPLVLALSTTCCYHIIQDSTDNYRSIVPSEGGFLYLWGAAAVKSSENQEMIRQFLKFLHQAEFQKSIPQHLWMYPVIDNMEIPEIYRACPQPANDLSTKITLRNYRNNYEKWLNRWEMIMLK